LQRLTSSAKRSTPGSSSSAGLEARGQLAEDREGLRHIARLEVRVDDGAVGRYFMVDTAHRRLVAVARRAIEAQYSHHIFPGLRKRRNAAVRDDRLFAGVVRGDREAQVVAEPLDEPAEMADARVDVLPWIEHVPNAEGRGGLRH